MIHKIFSVFDTKAEAYLQPFFSTTTGLATRSFAEAINDHNHIFNKHLADYCLFELGTFDDVTAKIEMLPIPHSLGLGNEYLKHSAPTGA